MPSKILSIYMYMHVKLKLGLDGCIDHSIILKPIPYHAFFHLGSKNLVPESVSFGFWLICCFWLKILIPLMCCFSYWFQINLGSETNTGFWYIWHFVIPVIMWSFVWEATFTCSIYMSMYSPQWPILHCIYNQVSLSRSSIYGLQLLLTVFSPG